MLETIMHIKEKERNRKKKTMLLHVLPVIASVQLTARADPKGNADPEENAKLRFRMT